MFGSYVDGDLLTLCWLPVDIAALLSLKFCVETKRAVASDRLHLKPGRLRGVEKGT